MISTDKLKCEEADEKSLSGSNSRMNPSHGGVVYKIPNLTTSCLLVASSLLHQSSVQI